MVDSERLKELTEEIGAEDLGCIIDLFVQEALDALAGIEAGSDAVGMARAIHFLRSGALDLGMRGLAAAAGAVEVREDTDPVATAAALRDVLRRTREQFSLGICT